MITAWALTLGAALMTLAARRRKRAALDCRTRCMLDERCPSYRTCIARGTEGKP